MANKITTLLDFKETGGLKKIKADVAAADTATGKFKAGWQGAMTSVKAYGAEAALAVGTTLVVASVKAGQEFANAAVEVGRFSDATGLSAEQASKWTSVADDLGVNVADVEKAFLRLNKEIGEGGGVAEQYGISLQKTADGQADVNATMLSAIDVINGIKDPTERARVAQELFGRSYANVAEIIFEDADKVASALESTSEAQIFDEDEIRKAREYRAAMDRFNDVMVDLKMTVGEGVVPVLSDAANAAVDFKEAVDAIPGVPKAVQMWWDNASPQAWIGHVADGWRAVGGVLGLVSEESKPAAKWVRETALAAVDAAEAAAEETRAHDLQVVALRQSAREATYNADALDEMGRIQAITTRIVDKAREAQRKFLDSIKHTRDEVGALKREIDDQQAWISMQEAFEQTNETLNDTETSSRDAYSAVLNLKEQVIDYAEQINLPQSVITRLIAQIDAGGAADVQAFLERIQNGVTLPINPVVRGAFNASSRLRGGPTLTAEGNLIAGRRARGGPVAAGQSYLVGEAGQPEILTMGGQSGQITPLDKVGGGDTYNISVNVTAGMAADDNAIGDIVVKAVQREIRFRGPISGWG